MSDILDFVTIKGTTDQQGAEPASGYLNLVASPQGGPGYVRDTGKMIPIDPEVEFTLVDNASGTGTLTIQVLGSDGRPPDDYYQFDLYSSLTTGGAPADPGDFTAVTGRIINEDTTDSVLRVQTDSAGKAVLTIADTGGGTTTQHISSITRVQTKVCIISA